MSDRTGDRRECDGCGGERPEGVFYPCSANGGPWHMLCHLCAALFSDPLNRAKPEARALRAKLTADQAAA